jgi:hypothetical protein
MVDLKSPRLIYFKGALFLLGGALSAALVLLESPTLRTALFLALAVWCFCRAYYFAFYVIEHYVDGRFKYAGLGAFLLYVLRGSGRE